MAIRVVFHGHSNLEIFSGEHTIQLDPFYNNNPLADVKADAVSPDFVLLTHAHFDHVDDVATVARKRNATVVANFEVAQHFEKQGLKTVGMNTGGGMDFPFGRATLTFAIHSSTFPDGANGGLPGGWIIQTGGKTIYHAGDTALFGDMALIGKLWKIDLACLPIGDCFTMGPDHAVLAAEMLKPRRVLPIHYNTFPQIRQDAAEFVRKLKDKTGIEGLALLPGESFNVL